MAKIGSSEASTTDAVIALAIAAGSREYDSRWDASGDGQVTSLNALMILQAAGMGREQTGRPTARSRLQMPHHTRMTGQLAMDTRSTEAHREAAGSLRALQEAMVLRPIRR